MKRKTHNFGTGRAALCLTIFGSLSWATMASSQTLKITIEPDDQAQQSQPFEGVRPAADMAILLDTSNSMDGLINQAKTQLWTIVQQFANAKKAGQTPLLRVAVFEYGNSGLPAREGYIRQVTGLTDDLDVVSEALFGLKTQGGDEYCGMVIGEALKRLDWSSEPNAFKTIFICGNEPFTQGQVDYRETCRKAIQSGVVVNTIHCGDQSNGVSGMWKDGADIAEGEFLNINQDKAVVAIKTPHDRILIELNEKLNRTYLWYGKEDVRKKYMWNQTRQDENAYQQLGAAGLGNRAAVKGGKIYNNVGRDLVDSWNADGEVLNKVDEDELPDSVRKMAKAEREAFLQQKAAERKQIQDQIAVANRKRVEYIANERKRLASAGAPAGNTLGDAVDAAVSKQLEKSGFQIDR